MPAADLLLAVLILPVALSLDDAPPPAAAASSSDGRPAAAASVAGSCGSAAALLTTRCDGRSDATHALQAALAACAHLGEALTLPPGKVCLSYPLILYSNTWLQLPAGATLKAAGPLSRWPNCSWPAATPFDDPLNSCKPNATGDAGMPFLRALPGARNLTIVGAGTIDGSGAQWWPAEPRTALLADSDRVGVGYHGPPRRPCECDNLLAILKNCTAISLPDTRMACGYRGQT